MRKLFLFSLVLLSTSLYAQFSIENSWEVLFDKSGLDQESFQRLAPHFPLQQINEESIASWQQSYPGEVSAVMDLPSVKQHNFSLPYLGLEVSESQKESTTKDAFHQWVVASGISAERLASVAPNYPIETNTKASEIPARLERWRLLYAHEYELLINDPQLTRLNPYYDEYQDVIQLPYFIQPLTSREKPVKPSASPLSQEMLMYELRLQTWHFVFQPESFVDEFGFSPRFPSWFNPDAYRADVLRKITQLEQEVPDPDQTY